MVKAAPKMGTIESYLEKTHSAAQKVYSAINSYYELLLLPQRPIFASLMQDEDVLQLEYEKWRLDNRQQIEERLKKDSEFAAETFAITTLCATILQFAYMGIKQFSTNSEVPEEFNTIIKPHHLAAKFCIGRRIDDVHVGLIIFAGRNQSHHYDEQSNNEPTPTVFKRLSEGYSPTFKKSFVDDRFDLSSGRIKNFAAHILDKLGWNDCEAYEIEILHLLSHERVA
jgi:hypothetical protein